MKMSNSVYDALKWTALVALPVATAATPYVVTIFALSVHTGAIVAGVLALVDAVLGAVLGISSAVYSAQEDAKASIAKIVSASALPAPTAAQDATTAGDTATASTPTGSEVAA